MVKLIAIRVAAMPVILFLRTVFFKQSKVMKEASGGKLAEVALARRDAFAAVLERLVVDREHGAACVQ